MMLPMKLLQQLEGEDQILDDLLAEAFKARPEFASLESQIRAQELTLSSIKGGYWPSLGVSTGLTDAGTHINNLSWNWNAGVTLTWPCIKEASPMAQVSEAHANILNLKAQLDAERNQIRLEVDQARLSVRATKAAISAADDAIVNAREQLRLAEGRYQTGVGNAIELERLTARPQQRPGPEDSGRVQSGHGPGATDKGVGAVLKSKGFS